jgi:hypothetical protein
LRSKVTRWMNVPFDTSAHFIAAHLHPFAESLQLRDLTEDKVVFTSLAHNRSGGKIGLEKVDPKIKKGLRNDS